MRSLLVLICIGLLGCGAEDFTPTPTEVTPTLFTPTESPISCKLSIYSDMQRGDISYTVRVNDEVLYYQSEQSLRPEDDKEDLTLLVNLNLGYNYLFVDWTYLDVYKGDNLWSGKEYVECAELERGTDTKVVILPEDVSW